MWRFRIWAWILCTSYEQFSQLPDYPISNIVTSSKHYVVSWHSPRRVFQFPGTTLTSKACLVSFKPKRCDANFLWTLEYYLVKVQQYMPNRITDFRFYSLSVIPAAAVHNDPFQRLTVDYDDEFICINERRVLRACGLSDVARLERVTSCSLDISRDVNKKLRVWARLTDFMTTRSRKQESITRVFM